jgi:hypothetical protein
MKLFRIFAFALLAWVGSIPAAWAQTTVSGHLSTLGGTAITSNAFVRFRLRNYSGNIPRLVGTGVCAAGEVLPLRSGGAIYYDVAPNSSGVISTTLCGNDAISPTNTFYSVELWANGTAAAQQNFFITGPTFNIDTAAPITTLSPPVVPNFPATANIALKPQTNDAIQYVSPNGADGNDGLSAGTAKLTITAACAALPGGNSSCSAGTGTIYLTAGYSGLIPVVTSTISVIGGRWNEYQAYSSLADCAKTAGIINIQVGPAGTGQNTGIPNQCVGEYVVVITDSVRNYIWGINPNVRVASGQGSGWAAFAIEADVDNDGATTTGSASGLDVVAGGGPGGAPNPGSTPLDKGVVVTTGNGATGFVYNFLSQSPYGSSYAIAPTDMGLQITQSITGSGSPQTVTTNAGVFTSHLSTQGWISIDTGVTNQEDVQVANLTNVGGVWSITGIFTKNHANNTTLFNYSGGTAFWEASSATTHGVPYHLGSLQQWVNATNPLGWYVNDTSGVARLFDYFSTGGVIGGTANQRVFRDIGGGWIWVNIGNTAAFMLLNTDGSLKLVPQAFVNLIACSSVNEGSEAYVNNSTTATHAATITGGGANHVKALCNGSNWVVEYP